MAELFARLQATVGDTYRIEKELGGGGMSRVFLAEETELERRVVIKVLPPEMAAGVNQDRFRREIQLAAKLQHPHIVPLLTAGSADDLLYYIMPYIEGESLRAKLAREGELPVGEVLRILRDVADALAYAHRHDVVHRDIKPDNVLLSDDHALVTDFGVAKAVSESTGGGSSLTSLGVALGTPAYMSPEQAAANPHVDHRADIYALGALAYEMLCGRPPFTGPNPQVVLTAQVTQAPDPLTTHRATVPPALNELVMRCLAKLPADRWQKADDLKGQFDVMTTPSGGMTPTGTQPVVAVSAELAMRQAHPVRVATMFALSSVGALAIVYVLVQLLGLPDWVFMGAIALLAIGFPIMMLTGHHERRRAIAQTTGIHVATPGSGIQRWFTWRRALMGGGLAFAGLAVVATAYTAMRAIGIGPVGTLMATGALEDQDRLIIADFENRTGDSTLGPSVTEAFRIDLAQSPVIRLMDVSEIAPVLQRMNRDPGSPLDREAALEVAEREGVKAVVAGEIGPVGSGYVLSARLIASTDGVELLGLRENAANEGELLPSIDRLSAKLRERIGESLRTIRANEPLERVTTASPDALRKYSQAIRAFDLRDYDRAIPLLEETIAIDTTFAMAYRKLAAALNNTGAAESRQDAAATKAFEHRDRLPDVERYLTVAQYNWQVELNRDEVRTAYLNVLDLDPNNLTALNNLALLMSQMNEPEEAERYALRGLEVGTIPVLYANAVRAQVRQSAFDRADSTMRRFEATSPGHPTAALVRGWIISAQRDFDGAEAHYQRLRDEFATRRSLYIPVLNNLVWLYQAQGRIAPAGRYGRELIAMAEEGDELDDYIVRTVFLARYDLAYRDAPAEGVAKVEAALERYPLDSMPLRDRPYLTLAGFYAEAGLQDRARELVDEYEQAIDEALRRGGLDDLYEAKGRIALADDQFEDAIGWFRQEAVEDRCLDCGDFDLARAYERAGQTDSALVEYERLISRPTVFRNRIDAFTLAPSYKRMGEIYEERDETDKAVEYYNNFVELWDEADAELQPQVEDVKNRIARLVGEPTSGR